MYIGRHEPLNTSGVFKWPHSTINPEPDAELTGILDRSEVSTLQQSLQRIKRGAKAIFTGDIYAGILNRSIGNSQRNVK